MCDFTETVTASVFAQTRGVYGLATCSLDKVGKILQESSEGQEFGNSSPIVHEVPEEVMTQTLSATVPSDHVVGDIQTRPGWQGFDVSWSDKPSVKLCLCTDFKGEWNHPMEGDEIEFKNSDGSTIYTSAFVTETPPNFSPNGEVCTYNVYPSSTVFTLYYTNGAMMQFIKPNEGVNIVGPENTGIYKQMFDEIDNGQKLDYLEPGKIVIPCFKVPEQKMSLLGHLSKFPSMFNNDVSFLRKILTDPRCTARIEKFDVTTSLSVNKEGTQFSSMMEMEFDVERGSSSQTDFILDSAFLWRIVYKNKAEQVNTVLVSGIVTDLD